MDDNEMLDDQSAPGEAANFPRDENGYLDLGAATIQEKREIIEKRALSAALFGKWTPEYFDWLRDRHLLTANDARKASELATGDDSAEDLEDASSAVQGKTLSRSDGSMGVSISADARAYTEGKINEAIRSLGNRAGQDPNSIAADLQSVLNEMGTGLEPEPLHEIAGHIASGEDVVIGITPSPEP